MVEPSATLVNDPHLILKNAKSSLVSLKEALKTKDPWDRDVEFHRRDARRQYLHLIFAFPYSPQTLAMDNPMWMETSHACIAAYRTRIAVLDKATNARANPPNGNNHNHNGGKSKKHDPGPVEHRKVVQRFRQFLAEEEKFWIAFILRFARSFALDEAQPRLEALQLNRNVDDPSSRKSTFPEEGHPIAPPPAQREKKILMLVKALISLGDLARYREQYNERHGRPKAGSEEVLPRWATKATRKPGENSPRPRNYARSLACYTQARLLFPDAGHASHQLAILYSYQSDTFGSILNYYRSLCVRIPFPMATENLQKTLTKSFETYRSEPHEEAKDDDPARAVVDHFKKDVVILHSMWKSSQVTEKELHNHTQHTLARFNKLLAERLLPIGLIVKIYIAALGALWTARVLRNKREKAETAKKSTETNDSHREGETLTHVMDLHLGLVKLAIAQLTPDTITDQETAAEKITAVLRRILQSLRVASRWVSANLDYLYRSAAPSRATPGLTRTLGDFWSSYATFATLLATTFPLKDLQVPNVALEEDVDLADFTPLKGSLKTSRDAISSNEVHPNDEYLLRIRDILGDANTFVSSEVTPLTLINCVYISSAETLSTSVAITNSRPRRSLSPSVDGPPHHVAKVNSPPPKIEEDDLASVSTEDPVTMAMRATLDQSDDFDGMEDEQILYPQTSWINSESHYDTPAISSLPLHQSSISHQHQPLQPLQTIADPHSFKLSDLGRHSYIPQHGLPVPPHPHHYQQDGLASTTPFAQGISGIPSLPSTSMPYGHGHGQSFGQPNPHSSMVSSSPPLLQQQTLFNASYSTPSMHPMHPMHSNANGLGISTSPMMNPNQHRLSFSGPSHPSDPIDSPGGVITTPPRTAQDLLMRVLGTSNVNVPTVRANPHQHHHTSHSSTSPGRAATSSSPESRPAPLLFGTSGNSIWAP